MRREDKEHIDVIRTSFKEDFTREKISKEDIDDRDIIYNYERLEYLFDLSKGMTFIRYTDYTTNEVITKPYWGKVCLIKRNNGDIKFYIQEKYNLINEDIMTPIVFDINDIKSTSSTSNEIIMTIEIPYINNSGEWKKLNLTFIQKSNNADTDVLLYKHYIFNIIGNLFNKIYYLNSFKYFMTIGIDEDSIYPPSKAECKDLTNNIIKAIRYLSYSSTFEGINMLQYKSKFALSLSNYHSNSGIPYTFYIDINFSELYNNDNIDLDKFDPDNQSILKFYAVDMTTGELIDIKNMIIFIETYILH